MKNPSTAAATSTTTATKEEQQAAAGTDNNPEAGYQEEIGHYAGLVRIKHKELRRIEKDEPLLYQQFAGDIKKLDSVYRALEKQLPGNPNHEQLMEAMVQDLQLQTKLLNHQLDIIKQINHSKVKAYEKALIKRFSASCFSRSLSGAPKLYLILFSGLLLSTPLFSRAGGSKAVYTQPADGRIADDDVIKRKLINKSYNVSTNDKLDVDNQFGNVMVSTWDKNEITVDVEIVAKASTDEKGYGAHG